MNDLRAFLVKATLDEEFRERVRRTPDEAFAGFELAEEERAILRRQGVEVLALIGKVLEEETATRQAPASAGEPAEEERSEPTEETHPSRTDPQWGHKLGSARARAAADTVRGAGDESRLDLLLDLISALRDPAAEDTEPAPPLVEGAPSICVVGLGLKNFDHLTVETDRVLRRARRVLYLDTGLATRELLEARCDDVVPLYGEAYVEGGSRVDAYHLVAARVLDAALSLGASSDAPVVFAIQGHPTVFCYPPLLIRDLGRMLGIGVEILPGISTFDCLCAELGVDPAVNGLQMFEATDLLLRQRPLQPDVPTLIWQVGTVETRLHSRRPSAPARLERLRDWLLRFYPARHEVLALFSSPHPLVPSIRFAFVLDEICDYAAALHPAITLYVPPAEKRCVADVELLARLDSPSHLEDISRG